MKLQPYIVVLCMGMFFLVSKLRNFQYEHTEMEAISHPFDSIMEPDAATSSVGYLPRGIMQRNSDMELKPLWSSKRSNLKDNDHNHRNLLAIPVGIRQKKNVDAIVKKFSSENFLVILFHYDGNVNGWHDLKWSNSAIHVTSQNQTQWWFVKRFLHPDVVSTYDYIFLWDEDLEVENFHPGRYVNIMKSKGLEISQPALDPSFSEIPHRITAHRKKGNLHGWVEGMAQVFSRSAWRCFWHLIQNDLIHGWGMDKKLRYCAQFAEVRKCSTCYTSGG